MSLLVEKMEDIPTWENPFSCDCYNMGTTIGTNLLVMHGNHPSERCGYLILVNRETGERHRISFPKPSKQDTEEEDGCWMDPAGGIHGPDEDDPAAMYK